MTSPQHVATWAANEYLNFHCQQMEMQEKLLRWQEIYDTTLAAILFFERSLQGQHRETLAYVSSN